MKRRKTLKMLIAAMLLSTVMSVTAFAFPMNNDWSTNAMIGWNHTTGGNIVRCVQSMMKVLNFNPGVIDGIYGGNTQNAIFAFQANNNLQADGTVGPNTWNKLYGYIWYNGQGFSTNPYSQQLSSTDNYGWYGRSIGFVKYKDRNNWEFSDLNNKCYPLW